MKRALFSLCILAVFHVGALSQGAPPITFTEQDGSPRKTAPTRIIVSNGTLTCSGSTCTLTTGGGSPGGSSGQIQYNNGGALDGALLLNFSPTASAVNGFTFTTATTGNPPTLSATGDDTNINFRISPKGAGVFESTGPLRLSGSGSDDWLTPVGIEIPTKINVPLYDPGAFGQILAMGLGASAQSSARVITLADARGSGHQPTFMILSPDEQQFFGFSWDGSNTDATIANSASGGRIIFTAAGGVQLPSAELSNLGTPAAGTVIFCSDCNPNSDPCTGSGTGAMAVRANSRWYCP